MRIRLSYIKRGTIGDGCEVESMMDVDELPRVGDCVFLSERHAQRIADFHPEGMSIASIPNRRYIVTAVEHKWDRLEAPVFYVIISTLAREQQTT